MSFGIDWQLNSHTEPQVISLSLPPSLALWHPVFHIILWPNKTTTTKTTAKATAITFMS